MQWIENIQINGVKHCHCRNRSKQIKWHTRNAAKNVSGGIKGTGLTLSIVLVSLSLFCIYIENFWIWVLYCRWALSAQHRKFSLYPRLLVDMDELHFGIDKFNQRQIMWRLPFVLIRPKSKVNNTSHSARCVRVLQKKKRRQQQQNRRWSDSTMILNS